MSCWLCVFLLNALAHAQTEVRYGKYFRYDVDEAWKRVYTENSYYLYKPSKSEGNVPVVIQAYGNAWRRPFKPVKSYMGPFSKPNDVTETYNQKGMAYVSLGYRAVDTGYYYEGVDGTVREEELIHVDPEGRLSLDTTGKRMTDYKVRSTWMELIVKSVYDVVAALEDLMLKAPLHGLDMHRIFFQASSAGSAELNYLTWVYHKWNVQRYTPVGMLLTDPQLNLPTFAAVGDALKLWVDHAGADMPLKKIMNRFECHQYLGNWRCDPAIMHGIRDGMLPTEICNETSNKLAIDHFCTAERFETATIGEVYQQQKWRRDDPDVGLGMEKVWYTARNMADHAPKPFHLFVSSVQHGMAHGGTAAYGYTESAHASGIDFVAYFLNNSLRRNSTLPGMPEPVKVGEYPGHVLLEVESFPWRSFASHHQVAGFEEHVLFVCYTFNLPCAAEPTKPHVQRKLRGIPQEPAKTRPELEEAPLLFN